MRLRLCPLPTHLAENCFMHQAEEKVTPEDRLDKACEPGVDYGKERVGGLHV